MYKLKLKKANDYSWISEDMKYRVLYFDETYYGCIVKDNQLKIITIDSNFKECREKLGIFAVDNPWA